jgi:Zn-dependent protease
LLFALGHPAALAGLLPAFLLGLLLRAVAVRATLRAVGLAARRERLRPRPREDLDPFGAVAAAVAGAGWGRGVGLDVPRHRGRGRAAAVFAAGPLVTLLASQLFFLAYALAYPSSLDGLRPSDVLRGQLDAPPGAEVLLALAVGLLCFGLLALLPVPPLDGFGLLWSALRRPGPGAEQLRLWLDHKNLGVAVLLLCCFVPLSYPLLLIPLDLIGSVFLRLWG